MSFKWNKIKFLEFKYWENILIRENFKLKLNSTQTQTGHIWKFAQHYSATVMSTLRGRQLWKLNWWTAFELLRTCTNFISFFELSNFTHSNFGNVGIEALWSHTTVRLTYLLQLLKKFVVLMLHLCDERGRRNTGNLFDTSAQNALFLFILSPGARITPTSSTND